MSINANANSKGSEITLILTKCFLSIQRYFVRHSINDKCYHSLLSVIIIQRRVTENALSLIPRQCRTQQNYSSTEIENYTPTRVYVKTPTSRSYQHHQFPCRAERYVLNPRMSGKCYYGQRRPNGCQLHKAPVKS